MSKDGKIPATEPAFPFLETSEDYIGAIRARPKRQVKLADKAPAIYPNVSATGTSGFFDPVSLVLPHQDILMSTA